MSDECYPITALPHISRLYREYAAMEDGSSMRAWYASEPLARGWMKAENPSSSGTNLEVAKLADLLQKQSVDFGASQITLENIEKLRNGAAAVVTGQQVGLFGGPLLTLLKAATAVARAREATAQTGREHVPVFWLASEDHDLAEVDQVSMPGREGLETLRLGLHAHGKEVGGVLLGDGVEGLLGQAEELLSYAPVCELLRECYSAGQTLGGAFARLMTRLFAAQGLVVMDASTREFHALGAAPLRAAVERAEELEEALLARSRELEAEGYHAQVLVKPGASLLFLIDDSTGERMALRRLAEGGWKAGARQYTTKELLAILDEQPERLSPNALLRPVFQDSILPTAAYIGGPAEVAYFAQSEVLYRQILGRVTPVLPRFSATLIEPAIATVMTRDEVTLKDLFDAGSADELTQRLGARAMPVEGKRRLAVAGNSMDVELGALTDYLASMDASLGRSAAVSASKMRYQMNRLRRMAASFEVQKEASLKKHATAMMLNLFPDGHPQERVIAGVWFIAKYGEGLVERLVAEAADMCTGHSVVRF